MDGIIYPCKEVISRFEMEDRVRRFRFMGIEVPLDSSLFIPRLTGYRGGLREYDYSKVILPGCVIDSHGNVVDFNDLERRASEALLKRDWLAL